MTEYFENLMENPNEYKNDIARNTLAILEEAKRYAKLSMDMFERYQETVDESDWNTSMEYDKRARGLLDAYQIMTGREVVNVMSVIESEILAYKYVFLPE